MEFFQVIATLFMMQALIGLFEPLPGVVENAPVSGHFNARTGNIATAIGCTHLAATFYRNQAQFMLAELSAQKQWAILLRLNIDTARYPFLIPDLSCKAFRWQAIHKQAFMDHFKSEVCECFGPF